MNKVNLGLLGSSGRMGKWVQELIANEFADRAILSTAVKSGESFETLLATQTVIDFSLPQAVEAFIDFALSTEAASLPGLIIGSTGWNENQKQKIKDYSKKAPVLASTNFSIGVYLLRDVLRDYSEILQDFGYEPVLVEAHHIHKKDAPSGTALTLQEAISPMNPSSVQTHAIRAGEVIGDHEVKFYSKGDVLTFSHSAMNRSIFARGAIEVALWLTQRRILIPHLTGQLTMDDFFEGRL